MNQKLYDISAGEIGLFMLSVGITEKKNLSFFENDGGIFERIFNEHMSSPEILSLKNISEDLYFRVLGMHAFGAGVYVAAKEKELKRPVSDFSEEETESIFADFEKADAYELALEKLGIPLESGNRKMLDRVIVIGIKEAKLFSGEKATEPENTKAFMKVLFNAGASMLR